ncbi:MAG: hypothetical protein ACKOXK_00080 [Chakrabartia sp.]
MSGTVVVTAPRFNAMSGLGSGVGSDLLWDSPIINFSGINAQIGTTLAAATASLSSLNYASLASLLASRATSLQHTPPPGYHFGAMDPMGSHYMIKDGDAKNSLLATPWYAAQVKQVPMI